MFSKLTHIIFGSTNTSFLFDIRFWLLLIAINCGANLGFGYYFPEQIVKIVLFVFCIIYLIFRREYKHISYKHLGFILSLAFILLFQIVYVSEYSLNTSIHYILMISIGVISVCICGIQFTRYFSIIIFISAVVSLVCYTLTRNGVQIPYIPITSTNVDDGNILRVYNIYYTQLGSPADGLTYDLRNCGPFWEPGAFQGFLNLSLFFELTMNQERNKWWILRIGTYIVTIITTFSTGGYVVLFVILFYYFSTDRQINTILKIILTAGGLALFYYLYTTLDFMEQKIVTDEGRVAFYDLEFPNPMYMFFGYGYNPNSFANTSMISASSVYNLLRYIGIVGFCIYMGNLLTNLNHKRIVYFIICTLILMNEPFLSTSMVFWGLPFVNYKTYNYSRLKRTDK